MDSRLTVLIDSDAKKALEKKAKSMGLNLSSYVRLVLMREIDDEN